MKTYAETKRRKPFDWNNELRLRIAGKQGGEYNLQNKSGMWTTCACGNQCAVIPRHDDGEPLDGILCRLGMDFHTHVVRDEWRAAKRTLAAIEARSATLIRRLKKKGRK